MTDSAKFPPLQWEQNDLLIDIISSLLRRLLLTTNFFYVLEDYVNEEVYD